MCKKGRLFVISAPSGAGKTTLCEKVLENSQGMVRSISMTTRQAREGEIEGRDYFFVSEKEFEKKARKNEFLEYAKVFGNYYGTPKKIVQEHINNNKDVMLNIDVQGAMQIKKRFRENSIFIFILPPSMEALKKRLLKRKTDSKAQIKKRLEVAKKELSYVKRYDYEIVNDKLKTAFRQLSSIIIAARCKITK